MKKQTFTGVFKTIFTSVMLASVLYTSVAKAEEKKSGKITPYELKYVGKVHEQPIFQLNIENTQNEDLYLSLEDEVGNILYTEKFSEKNFSKKFQFDLSQSTTTKIKMTVSTKSSRQSQVFEINNVQTLVENVVVTKV
jgi:hypothetical protein